MLFAANVAGKRIALYTNSDCRAGAAVITEIPFPK